VANETTYSGLETAGSRVAETIAAPAAGALDRVLHDPTDLGAFCVMVPYAPGSSTNQVYRKPAPVALTAASSETSGGASRTVYTPVGFTLAPTRRYGKFAPTDLALLTDPVTTDPTDPRFPEVIADILQLLKDSVRLTITDVLTALFTSLSTTVGDTVQPLRADHIFDGQFALNMSNVPITADRPAICTLAPRQMNHLQDDLRGESGVMAWQTSTADMLAAHGPGLIAKWNNILFVQSDSCPLSDTNTNRNGAMFGWDAFAAQLAPVAPVLGNIPPGNLLFVSEFFFIELSRDADNGITDFLGNAYLTAAIAGENARGVRVRSSAS
jgi:hypothetical protein